MAEAESNHSLSLNLVNTRTSITYYVQLRFCPGGFCPGDFVLGGILSRRILSGGGFVRRDFVLEPLSICKEATTDHHFSVKGAIAYQTVQAKVNIPVKLEVKCRMLLDTGCDRTYINQSFTDKLCGKPVRFERKVLDTVHGDKVHRCAIYNLEIKDLKEVLQCTTEADTLSKLTSVRYVRSKILKEQYQHLNDLEFSDVSDEEELDAHVILGLEDLYKLRTGKMVWGGAW